MPVRFVRTKKRTVTDIFNSAISPRIKAELNTLGNNIVLDARKTHEFKNRTGALEASIQWTPPERESGLWRMVVFAGGWSVVKFAFNAASQFYKSKSYVYQRLAGATTKTQVDEAFIRRNYQTINGVRRRIKKGEGRYVNYAQYVERRGYSVLINSVEKYRRMATAILGRALKLRGV